MVSGELDRDSGSLSIKVKGDILSTNAEDCAASIGGILKKNAKTACRHLKLDLKSANMIDSVGLNMILGLIRNLQANGSEATIYISSPAVNRVFLFSRLNTIVNVVFKRRRRR